MKIADIFYCEEHRCWFKVVATDPTPRHPDGTQKNWEILVRKYNPTTRTTEGDMLEYKKKGK